MNETHPVIVIGAGPIGLAAAAHLLERHQDVRILEAVTAPGPPLPSGGTSSSSPPGATTSMRHPAAFWKPRLTPMPSGRRRALRPPGCAKPPAWCF